MDLNERLEKLHEESDNYFENKDYENALICLKEIYEIDPDDIDNLGNMVGIYLILKRYSEAIKIAESLPEDCWARYDLIGHYHNVLNQKEDELKNYLKAHELNPKEKQPLFDLAFFYKFEDEYEKSFEYTFKMLEIDEKDIDALALLINLYFDTHQFDKVIDLSYRALAISDERDEMIYPPLAFSFLIKEEQEKGWNCLVEAIFKHPDEIIYYTTLGTYAFAINDDKKALDIFNVALIKNPSSPELYLALAMHYKTGGDLKNARKNYDKYLELEDEHLIMEFDEF